MVINFTNTHKAKKYPPPTRELLASSAILKELDLACSSPRLNLKLKKPKVHRTGSKKHKVHRTGSKKHEKRRHTPLTGDAIEDDELIHLRKENQVLRDRLDEAEEALAAMTKILNKFNNKRE